jgi:hypothetical protein
MGVDEKPHAVCVPFQTQGHITPVTKLAKVLHSKGFHLTLVNTEYNHRRLIGSHGPDVVAGLSASASNTTGCPDAFAIEIRLEVLFGLGGQTR